MQIPMIVSLSGQKESGKNTVADILTARYGYHQIAWADALREEVVNALNLTIKDQDLNYDFPDLPEFIKIALSDTLIEVYDINEGFPFYLPGYVYSKPTPPKLRKLLQLWGTNYRRNQDPTYWLKKMRFVPGVKYVITDTRFQNEVDLAKLFGAYAIKINPVGFPEKEVDTHVSEKIDLTGIDLVVDNVYGNLDTLEFDIGIRIESAIMIYNVSKICMVEWSPNENSR